MSYRKGSEVLPAHLLKAIQEYIDGELVYIPKKGEKAGWGCLSGSRKSLDFRNTRIKKLFYSGYSIESLSKKFYLSEDTIRKIVYRKE